MASSMSPAGLRRRIRTLLATVGGALLGATLLACGAGEEVPRLRLEPALGGASFEQPVEVAAYPGDRVIVAERGGAVWAVSGDGERTLLGDLAPLVEAERGEGLLSVALDPAFEENGRLWVYYFAAEEPWRTVLARLEVAGDQIDLATRLVVLEMAQPGFNQNGGAIRFDSHGLLYLSVGDGSASTDPFEQGQDPSTLLATVLRLDVSAAAEAEPYRVPPSNPFVGREGYRPEIFAYGFRNPWRMSIDPAGGAGETDTVWIGDVGFTNAEEVNRVEAGLNYGWSILEGTRCLARECDPAGLEPPVYAYAHEEGRCAVVGGVVYRGSAIPALRGRYLFGDLCTGEVWMLPGGTDAEAEPLARLEGMLVTFGLDPEGEVLVADYGGGGVYRLVEDR